MGKLLANPKEVRAALEQRLEPDEQLRYSAYGLQQSAALVAVVIIALMIPALLINLILVGPNAGLIGMLLFWVIWGALTVPVIPLLRKDFMAGLTDRRLLVLRVKTPLFAINLQEVLSSDSYPLSQLGGVQTRIGPMRVFIKLKHAEPPLDLQFGGRGFNENYQQAVGIAEALSR